MDILAVMRKYEARLMELPNVNGVGIGEKEGRQVIRVFVTRKVPKSSLDAAELVPRTLDGCETDVEEIGVVVAQPLETP